MIRRHSSSLSRTRASSGVSTRPRAASSRWRSSSGVTRPTWSSPTAPALLTRMSSGPRSPSTCAIARSTAALSLTSATTARPPPIASTVRCALGSAMSSAATAAPSAARRRHIAAPTPAPPPPPGRRRIAAPTPAPPPVTAAVLPCSRIAPAAAGAGSSISVISLPSSVATRTEFGWCERSSRMRPGRGDMAAVDRVDAAGDERRVVGGEEAHELRDVLRPAHAVEDLRCDELPLAGRRVVAGVDVTARHRRLDHAGAVAVAAHVRSEVDRRLPCELDDATLRRAVGGRLREAEQTRHGARVDDVRAAARAPKVRGGELRRQPWRAQVRLVDGVPDVLGQRVDRAVRREGALDHARVVDEHVEPAEALDRRRDHGLDLVAVAQVAGDDVDVGAEPARERRRLGGGLRVAVHHGQTGGAPPRHLEDDRAAQPLARAGHDCDPRVEHRQALAFSAGRPAPCAAAMATAAARPSEMACATFRGTSASPIARTVGPAGTSALQSRATRSPTTTTVSASM